jgi:hypothetical protein
MDRIMDYRYPLGCKTIAANQDPPDTGRDSYHLTCHGVKQTRGMQDQPPQQALACMLAVRFNPLGYHGPVACNAGREKINDIGLFHKAQDYSGLSFPDQLHHCHDVAGNTHKMRRPTIKPPGKSDHAQFVRDRICSPVFQQGQRNVKCLNKIRQQSGCGLFRTASGERRNQEDESGALVAPRVFVSMFQHVVQGSGFKGYSLLILLTLFMTIEA